MRKPKRNTNLWIYLNQAGVLDTEDEIEIRKSIKDYYRNYDTLLKQGKRKEKRTFTISFPSAEILYIRRRAKQYDSKIIDYIKLLVKADISNTSPIENAIIFKQILQILQYYKNTIKEIEEKEIKNWLGVNKNYETFSKIIESTEKEILSLIKKHE